MEFISYNRELAVASLLFQRCFNNIRIEHTDAAGNTSWVKIPCVNAQRSRVLKGFENKDRTAGLRLPMISFTRTGYSRAPDRLNNLHNEVKYEITSAYRNQQIMTPVPVDISFDLTVYAKYQADVDKIASNFMVFFNNAVYVSCQHPKYQGVKMHNQIVMSDGVSEEHPDEIDGAQDDFITSTFQFTFKTYLFAGTSQYVKRKITRSVPEISSYVDGDGNVLTSEVWREVETDEEAYDGIPIVKSISVGFYDVPRGRDIDGYALSVDGGLLEKHYHLSSQRYVSSDGYAVEYETRFDDDGNQLCAPSRVVGVDDRYEPLPDWYCSHSKFVDRLLWRIDGASVLDFPANVRQYPGC